MRVFLTTNLFLISNYYHHSVTRLIKASKSSKPNRDSYAGPSGLTPASGSTVSLKSDFSSSLIGSSKLSAAQAELQACEAQLAARERELDEKRASAVREGIGARAKAMVECGWAWGEMGKESLRALETLHPHTSEIRGQYFPARFHIPAILLLHPFMALYYVREQH